MLSVVEPAPILEPVMMGGPGGPGDDAVAVGRYREQLRAAIPADVRAACEAHEVVAVGKPYREILRVAAEQHSDLVVLGAYGGSAGLYAFGSTTTQVVRQAACPVLTLKAE